MVFASEHRWLISTLCSVLKRLFLSSGHTSLISLLLVVRPMHSSRYLAVRVQCRGGHGCPADHYRLALVLVLRVLAVEPQLPCLSARPWRSGQPRRPCACLNAVARPASCSPIFPARPAEAPPMARVPPRPRCFSAGRRSSQPRSSLVSTPSRSPFHLCSSLLCLSPVTAEPTVASSPSSPSRRRAVVLLCARCPSRRS
jgi:hypothetical protein